MAEIDRYGRAVDRVAPQRPPQPPLLTGAELKAVLDVVVAYTKIEPDKTLIEVWAAQSGIGRWTYDEAVRAVHQWAADRAPNAFLEPSDVTRAIRAARQDRALRAEQRRLEDGPAADPASAERITQIVGHLAKSMGWTEEGQERVGLALRVGCPYCGAPVGTRCTTPATGKPLRRSPCHPARAEALVQVDVGAFSREP